LHSSRLFHRSASGGKESPGSKEHHTPEIGDIREGIVTEKKITVAPVAR